MNDKLEWQALWDAMDENPAEWIPTTEKMYWDMLEAVPPRAQKKGAFLVGEANHDNSEGYPVYSAFKRVSDNFYAKHMTYSEFDNEFAYIPARELR
jgi:hypothetical protein